jgi:hypothetical protein
MGINRSLWIFGFLQALSNLTFTMVALLGKNYPAMIAAIGIENICGGLGTAAFVAFLMSLCDKRFTATQYALLSSLMAMRPTPLPCAASCSSSPSSPSRARWPSPASTGSRSRPRPRRTRAGTLRQWS